MLLVQNAQYTLVLVDHAMLPPPLQGLRGKIRVLMSLTEVTGVSVFYSVGPQVDFPVCPDLFLAAEGFHFLGQTVPRELSLRNVQGISSQCLFALLLGNCPWASTQALGLLT
jgi:hypothetical protein